MDDERLRRARRSCRRASHSPVASSTPAIAPGFIWTDLTQKLWSQPHMQQWNEALREGLRVRAVGGAFTLGGRAYPIGTALVRASECGVLLDGTCAIRRCRRNQRAQDDKPARERLGLS